MTLAILHAFMPRCPAGKQSCWLRCLVFPLLLPLLLLGSDAVLAADASNMGEVDQGPVAMAPMSGIQTTALDWRVSHTELPAPVSIGAGGLPGASPTRVVQTMVWTARPSLQLGLGIEKSSTPPSLNGILAPNMADAGLLVGLRLAAGPSAHLTWQAPLWLPDAPIGYGQTRQMRLALALALTLTPQDPYADLRRGLLTKVELSGQTTQALRPRGGRIGLLLNNHW